ncbi:MAG: type II toxin-antitoxin system YafQ family toxin [Anaerolineales bacterium]
MDQEKLRRVIKLLLAEIPLEEQYRDHPLRGKFAGARDCHIEPDWVLI